MDDLEVYKTDDEMVIVKTVVRDDFINRIAAMTSDEDRKRFDKMVDRVCIPENRIDTRL